VSPSGSLFSRAQRLAWGNLLLVATRVYHSRQKCRSAEVESWRSGEPKNWRGEQKAQVVEQDDINEAALFTTQLHCRLAGCSSSRPAGSLVGQFCAIKSERVAGQASGEKALFGGVSLRKRGTLFTISTRERERERVVSEQVWARFAWKLPRNCQEAPETKTNKTEAHRAKQVQCNPTAGRPPPAGCR